MKPLLALRSIFLNVILFGNVLAAVEGEERSFPLPEEYARDYVVASDTVSPDGKFALIVPNGDPEAMSPHGKNYLVALQPFAVIGALETESPYFAGESHGGITAEWSGDSSVALVTLGSKWGPGDVFLLELKDGKLARMTNLLTKAHDLLVPDYRKAKPKPEPYNDDTDFVFVAEDPVCTLDGTGVVKIAGNAATDPKGGDPHRWKAHLTATWDIVAAKFTQQKITRKGR